MILVGVVGCTSWRAKSSFDAAAVSRQYRTYSLLAADTLQPAVESALEREVERQLATKGLVPVAPGQQPDILVIYDLAGNVQKPLTQRGASKQWATSFGGMGVAAPPAFGYSERTVALRFVDARTRETFWRGSASSPVGNRTSPNEVTTPVDNILRRFPSEAVAGAARPAG